MMDKNLKPRRELLRLRLPIEDERTWHDDERGAFVWKSGAFSKDREHLNGLSEPHVVCKTRSKARLLHVKKPTKAKLLIST